MVTLALGLKDRGRNLNILRIFGPDGVVMGEYHKNHLVTQHEGSIPGTTPPAVVTTGFGELGTMICNDDTFTAVDCPHGFENIVASALTIVFGVNRNGLDLLLGTNNVLERGAGWTQACGTGACAAAVAILTNCGREKPWISGVWNW